MEAKKMVSVFFVVMMFLAFAPATLAYSSKYASEPVFMREGPGTKYSIILELQKGDRVEAAGTYNNWMEVQFQGKTGFVFSKYLVDHSIADKPAAKTTASVNMRSGAGAKYKKLVDLSQSIVLLRQIGFINSSSAGKAYSVSS